MNDERLDALLRECDPVSAAALNGVEGDVRGLDARRRIRASGRAGSRHIWATTFRLAVGALGLAALATGLVVLLIAAPGDGPEAPAGGIVLTDAADRPPAPNLALPMVEEGVPHKVGWNFPHAGFRVVRPHPLVVTFTDSWCEPCQADLAVIERIWRERAVGDLAVLGVAGATPVVDLRSWWSARGATFPLARDRDGAAGAAFGVAGIPVTVLIDREGRVAGHIQGPASVSELERAIDALLAEPAPAPDPGPQPIAGPVPPSALDLAVFAHATPVAPNDAPDGLGSPTTRVYAEGIRLALRSPSGRAVWVARGGGDHLLMTIAGPTGVAVTAGGPAAEVARLGGVSASGRDGVGEDWYGGGIVVDGYTTASGGGRTVPIVNNVFLFEGGAAITEVTVSGPAGTRRLRL